VRMNEHEHTFVTITRKEHTMAAATTSKNTTAPAATAPKFSPTELEFDMDLVTEVMRRKNEGESVGSIAKELNVGAGKAAMAVLVARRSVRRSPTPSAWRPPWLRTGGQAHRGGFSAPGTASPRAAHARRTSLPPASRGTRWTTARRAEPEPGQCYTVCLPGSGAVVPLESDYN
jgi:hypothetical protein